MLKTKPATQGQAAPRWTEPAPTPEIPFSTWHLINEIQVGASRPVCEMATPSYPKDDRPYGEALGSSYPMLSLLAQGFMGPEVAGPELSRLVLDACDRGSFAMAAAAAACLAIAPDVAEVVLSGLTEKQMGALRKLLRFTLAMPECASCWGCIKAVQGVMECS